MAIKLTNLPKRGDAVLGILATNKIVFATHESMMSNTLDTSVYEYIGVVLRRSGKKVLYAYKENASKKWSDRYAFKLTGYTLDGTSRTGTLNVRTASDWGAAVAYTISYNASTLSDFVSQLNTAFQDNTNYPALKTQDWYAELDSSNNVVLHFAFSDYRQASNTGSAGFALTANLLPNCTAIANMRRNNGATGGEGAISSMERAIAYFYSDLNSSTYNPTSNVTSIARTYPICKPGYLGTSQYSGGADRCADLRAVFGEGEAGWLKFMESCLPILPTDWGNMGMRNGKERTAHLASQTYVSNTQVTPKALCPAADYCANISTSVLPKGTFWLPTTEEVAYLLKGIKYGTINDRNADIVNALQNKMGGSAISNGSYFWSCLRSNTNNAWYAHGSYGFFYGGVMCYANVCVPVSLYELP